jgi:hypothetical protein
MGLDLGKESILRWNDPIGNFSQRVKDNLALRASRARVSPPVWVGSGKL